MVMDTMEWGRAPARNRSRSLQPVRDWRIHLGAHKTATTHLQETLAAVRVRLAARGVDFIPLGLLREQGLARDLKASRPAARLPMLRRILVPRVVGDHLSPLRRGPDCLVLSEENLLGAPHDLLDWPIYPNAETIVARLATLAQGADLTFFLAIRSFDALLPSAYAEALKFGPPPEGGFEKIRARVLARPPSWFDFARRLLRAAPGVRLRIWRQEDYRAHQDEILARLCGCALEGFPELPDPARTRSPGAAAVARAEALPRDLGVVERTARVRADYLASLDEAPRFQPFADAEVQRLRRAYTANVARLAGLGPDVLMRF